MLLGRRLAGATPTRGGQAAPRITIPPPPSTNHAPRRATNGAHREGTKATKIFWGVVLKERARAMGTGPVKGGPGAVDADPLDDMDDTPPPPRKNPNKPHPGKP